MTIRLSDTAGRLPRLLCAAGATVVTIEQDWCSSGHQETCRINSSATEDWRGLPVAPPGATASAKLEELPGLATLPNLLGVVGRCG
ncbi:hypothetical protein NL676_023775 [Syzygium grande]|nr:hypothetical protein NL676_023775 [Syzygium grande]